MRRKAGVTVSLFPSSMHPLPIFIQILIDDAPSADDSYITSLLIDGHLTTTDVYWYTNHVSSSASIHGQFYKREGTPSGTHSDPSRSMLHGALSEK